MDKQMLIQPGIQPGGQLNAYLVRAAMSAVSSPNFDNQYGDTPQAPEWFAVNGAGLLNTGLTNTG
ncbi:MAG: hypothetical protein P4N59_05735, partial [Negativicutes bacterium]|nr:hypothetical protein [Negativicutes bacterium]